ncbi:MAG: HAMP domain-containing sensor histidine kinase, partial [Acidobacteriota bacterium]
VARAMVLVCDGYVARLAADPLAPLPESRWLRATFDIDELPASLRPFADRDDGVHGLESGLGIEGLGGELYLLARTLDDGRRLYLYLDADEIEVLDEYFLFIAFILLSAAAVVTTVGVGLGRLTARRVVAPVVELADRVRGLDTASDGVLSSEGFADDEVGLLARALEASTARSRAFLDRERRFTRDASHELRSPVTVVRGAVELLDSLPEAEVPRVRRPLGRIRRAADDMERLIDAFLWLAREEELSEGRAPRSLVEEVASAIERHRHLLDGKPVEIENRVDPAAGVEAPDGVLGIVLGNLVANACFYTQSGRIVIRGDGDRIEVVDTGPGIPEARRPAVLDAHERGRGSQGFGLGLAIVRDLCERFGWRLRLDAGSGDAGSGDAGSNEGTRAVVTFGS